MIIAPHQDDETLGCGGLIAHKRYEGWPVHVVFLTDGGSSHPNHPRLTVPEIVARRRWEASAALLELGVESCAVHFLDEPDGSLDRMDAARARAVTGHLAELFTELQPAEVFLPCCPDGSSEHNAAFALVTAAIHQARQQPVVWQYPIWCWWNPSLLLRHIVTARGRARLPNADFTLGKRTAVACYDSQINATPPWTAPVLPPDLLASLLADTEYFFEHPLPPPHGPAAEI